MNRRLLTVAAAVLSLATFARAEDLPPTPRLLLNNADVELLKQKIAGPFAGQWKALLADADKLAAADVNLPPRGGNWSHNYVCPEHGARLKRGKQIGPWEWEHICPVGNHVLRGDPSKATTDFDGNAIMAAHLDYADGVATLGIAYQVTGDKKYAARAKDILLAYADMYRSYPVHDNQGRPGGKGGHVASQSLTEASWLIDFTQGADLVWDTLSADERKRVEDGVMRPALTEIILPQNYGIHNIQCRQNSAIGLVGLLLDDKKLIARAIDDPKVGFRQQIAQGVQDDGMWREGASGYHFFTLGGLWPLAEAARHCGIDLYSPRYKSMFDAPMQLAMPDLRLPNFNDSGIVNVAGDADAYELAYARWHDPAYLRILGPSKRTGRLALLYGVPELPKAEASTAAASGSRNYPASGYAILQSGEGRGATWLCVKYGPHGGGHGHPDKNTFILYKDGHILAADAGTHAYGSPLHAGWDKTTVAHNTLVVDETSQAPATGRYLAFGSDHGIDYAMTDAGEIYKDKGVRFVRTVVMLDAKTIVGIDTVTTDGREHVLDFAFHLPGSWADLPEGEPWKATAKTGYAFIESATMRTYGDHATLNVTGDHDPVALTLVADMHPTDVITGTGVGESTEDHVPAVIFRQRDGKAKVAWVITLDGRTPEVRTLPRQGNSVCVQVDGSTVTVDTDAATVHVVKATGVQKSILR